MSDSFADLWSSSAPLPPKSKPQTLASASTSSIGTSLLGNQPYRSTTGNSSKPDVFALLAGSGPGKQQQIYSSPNPSFRAAGGRSNGGTPSSAPVFPRSDTSSSGSRGSGSGAGSDAFSDLFSSSSSKQQGSGLNVKGHDMTIAARMAMESHSKTPGAIRGVSRPLNTDLRAHDTAWAGLDSLAGSGTSFSGLRPSYQTNNSTSSRKLDGDDDWGLGDFGSGASLITRTHGIAQPQPQQPLKDLSKDSTTLWDLDEIAPSPFLSSSAQQSRPSSQPNSHFKSHQQKPTKKEFSDRPDSEYDYRDQGLDDPIPRSGEGEGLLDFDAVLGSRNGERGDEDDILGMLSQPVEAVKAQTEVRVSFRSFNLKKMNFGVLFSMCNCFWIELHYTFSSRSYVCFFNNCISSI